MILRRAAQHGGLVQYLRDQRPPGGLGWGRLAAILAGGFLDMAGPAKRLEAVRVVWVLARLALQRRDVIYLKPTCPPAPHATPAVALEHGATGPRPSAPVYADVVSAHAILGAVATRQSSHFPT